MNKIEECIAGVAEFNVIAGSYEGAEKRLISLISTAVSEAANETRLAAKTGLDDVKILGGVVDVLFAAHSLAGFLNTKGFDVYGAWLESNRSELTRFPSTQTDAFYTKVGHEGCGVSVEVVQHDSTHWVVKDEYGRIVNNINYVPADLSKYLPKGDTQ